MAFRSSLSSFYKYYKHLKFNIIQSFQTHFLFAFVCFVVCGHIPMSNIYLSQVKHGDVFSLQCDRGDKHGIVVVDSGSSDYECFIITYSGAYPFRNPES